MRKIPREQDNPFENLCLDIAGYISPVFKDLGHTANTITLLSLITGLWAIKSLKERNFKNFAIGWIVSFFFDCMDGYYARRYSMVSNFGDTFDHVKDFICFGLYSYVMLTEFNVKPIHFIILTIFGLLSLKHVGCQQILYKKSNPLGGKEFLDSWQKLCNDPRDIYWTRYFGLGTFNIILVLYVYYLMYVEK